jgi:DNA-binding response OmpR family regulator
MGILQRLMRLFGQPAPVAGEEVILPEPPFIEGTERRMKERKPSASGIKVLIIDDSTTIVALLRRMMRQNDFETLEAGDAEGGIEIARTEVPHLIFLDIVLPGMNGFNALRVLRRDPLTRHIPIIMISGNEQATEEFYVHRIGADDFMKKPFARAEVFARIERLMDGNGTPRRVNVPATEVG